MAVDGERRLGHRGGSSKSRDVGAASSADHEGSMSGAEAREIPGRARLPSSVQFANCDFADQFRPGPGDVFLGQILVRLQRTFLRHQRRELVVNQPSSSCGRIPCRRCPPTSVCRRRRCPGPARRSARARLRCSRRGRRVRSRPPCISPSRTCAAIRRGSWRVLPTIPSSPCCFAASSNASPSPSKCSE